MHDMMKRHEVQVLRRAGHTQAEVARLTGVSERSVREIEAEPSVASADDAGERSRRRIGRPSKAEQKLPEPVTDAKLVLLRRFSRPYQIANRLVRRVRYPDGREIAGTIAARQFQRVAPVRLDPVSSSYRHQRRRHHVAVHTQPHQPPVQDVSGRTRLVADAQVLPLAQPA